MQSMKEAAANAGASARAGFEKTKASIQENVNKMKKSDPAEKEMARERKDERKYEAERQKQEAYDQNAAARQVGHGYTTSGQEPAAGYGGVDAGHGSIDTVPYGFNAAHSYRTGAPAENTGYTADHDRARYAYTTMPPGAGDYDEAELAGWRDDVHNTGAGAGRAGRGGAPGYGTYS